MKPSRQAANGTQQRRLRRTLSAAALAAALCLGAAGCGNDLLGGDDTSAAPKEKRGLGARDKATEKSVRAFYARTTKAYRTRNAQQLCQMTQPAYADVMVKKAAAAGVDVTNCREVWQLVFDVNPNGYKDKITNIAVKGKTATFLSGDDPWRIRLIQGEWLIVHQG